MYKRQNNRETRDSPARRLKKIKDYIWEKKPLHTRKNTCWTWKLRNGLNIKGKAFWHQIILSTIPFTPTFWQLRITVHSTSGLQFTATTRDWDPEFRWQSLSPWQGTNTSTRQNAVEHPLCEGRYCVFVWSGLKIWSLHCNGNMLVPGTFWSEHIAGSQSWYTDDASWCHAQLPANQNDVSVLFVQYFSGTCFVFSFKCSLFP